MVNINPLRRTVFQSAAVVGHYFGGIHCARGDSGHQAGVALLTLSSNTGVVV